MLEAKNITQVYYDKNRKENTILSGLDLKVNEGEFVCLIGMSGCGKSTLLRLLSGLELPTSGEVISDGKKLDGPLKSGAFVFQDYALFPWRTVIRNVEFGARINKIYPKDEIRQKAEEYLKLTHLYDYKDAYIHQLSGGMKQRVAIARALIMQPKFLFMDEPFGALDSFTRIELQNLLKDIVRERSLSVVFVTHDIDEAIFLGDRVIIMGKGSGKIEHDIAVRFEGVRDRTNGEFEIFRELIFNKFDLTRKYEIEYSI